jgi:hypothetical protein
MIPQKKGMLKMALELTYSDINGYKIPNLSLPDDGLDEEISIGVWGLRRLDYLKQHRRVLYSELLTSGKLRAHLHEIDTTAHERRERLITQMKAAQGVTEQLKAENQMLWVGKMNNICASADEIIRNELIYE